MSLTLEDAGRALADPAVYADDRRLHEALTLLRREDPVHRVEAPGYNPFWAVTRHADIMEVERQHGLFVNAPRPLLATAELDEVNRLRQEQGMSLRTLVHIDDPDHRVLRAIGADWFRPRAMRALESRVRELARRYVDRMAELGGECDFVQQIAVKFPLQVILSLLGLPESDFDRMLRLTQELFGGDDDERQRGTSAEEKLQVLFDFFAYFRELTAARRARPTDDLASTIANARVDGEPLNDLDTASYYVIIATAGHDTTSSTIAGGLHALVENPGELARLRADPGLMPLAVDEMIRWTTPVKEFMRTATDDCELRGVPIRKGDALLLSYPSANRDEDVFADPFRFDVGRDPNKHLAFGFGVHYCLGAALARIEVRAFFEELLPRLGSVELAGEPRGIATTFVGGLKRLPVRYTLRG
ncbi:Cytochrome P450-terp [Actinomadura rubteroloni]|uniref:Cytochrome P450-terp n=1 Tax=Actinomadura rubteroloni TaxID=1926885 RepID=A0A2P4UNC8_9ACTN|nr:cytochrome P450 [Actinomadura rubteroloni]POM26529.1 Cytochrome P450-terp [Actinomadura rubteroloni]